MRRVVVLVLLAVLAPAATAGAKPALRRFHDCRALVRYGAAHRDAYRAGGQPPPFVPTPTTSTPTGMPVPAPAAEGADGGYSLTNGQEAGVMEPDIVKTDGKRVFAVTSAGMLEVVDVTGAPRVVGRLDLPGDYDHQLLLYGDTLLVGAGAQDGSVLALVDVSDPAHPRLTQTLTVGGGIVAMRRTHQTVRVVLGLTPYAVAQPDRPAAAAAAWLPRGTLRNLRRHTTSRRTLAGCRAIRRPRRFSGLGELTVLTLDLDNGLAPVDADAVMTAGQTVYASASNLFVATQRYEPELESQTGGPVPPGQTTEIHRFSLDDADTTTYRGSGTVAGFVLGQFSLSEAGDVLRVASTDIPPWFAQGDPSHSLVTTLAERSDRLEPLGKVDGIGQGERIFAVRFLGDVGYVVTFRQVDPLFTVDVSDPASPRVRGSVEISGVSSYLHPLDGDRLLGIGSGPNEDGTQNGLQLSEFDVSDLDHPKLEQRLTLDRSSSEAQSDHHAFVWWAPRHLAILPVSTWDTGPTCQPPGPCPLYPIRETFAGAGAFSVTPSALTEAGRVAQDGSVRRSIVIGDRLLTMSDAGLKATSLDDFSDGGFAAF